MKWWRRWRERRRARVFARRLHPLGLSPEPPGPPPFVPLPEEDVPLIVDRTTALLHSLIRGGFISAEDLEDLTTPMMMKDTSGRLVTGYVIERGAAADAAVMTGELLIEGYGSPYL